MKIIVRPMTIDDYEPVHQVDILTQSQYLGNKFDELSPEEQDKNHLVSRKTEFQINVNSGYCFVAEDDGKIVGFLLSHETLPFHGTLNINYIGLNPEYQGRGVGLLLYNKLIEKAKQKGIAQIKTHISLDNPKSIRLHQKAGFKLKDRKEATLKLG